MEIRRRWIAASILVLAVCVVPAPARAEVPVDAWDLLFWTGWYEPGPEALSGDLSYGARIGKHFGLRSMLSGEFAYTRLDVDAPSDFGDVVDKLTSFEFTYNHYFLPDWRTSVALFAGLGWANNDFNVGGGLALPFETGENSFTVGGGGALRINVAENFYLRPALRLKWFEDRDSNTVDAEFQIGFGLVLY